nr:substrate-binding domain-containing protein [Lachnoanaerobaculum saburreum]
MKVGISIYKFDDNFMTLYRNELVRYLTEDCGIPKDNIVVQDGKNDQAEQTNQINNFIATKVDVMILNLVQSSSAPTVTDLAKEAGIPVVLLDVIAELRIHERLIAVGTAVLHVFSPQELFNDSVAEQFFVDVVVVRHTLLRAVTLF